MRSAESELELFALESAEKKNHLALVLFSILMPVGRVVIVMMKKSALGI